MTPVDPVEASRRWRRAFRPEILERLGILPRQLEPTSLTQTASVERSRQATARLDALKMAQNDAMLDRLARAERDASLTGQSIAEGWDAFPSTE